MQLINTLFSDTFFQNLSKFVLFQGLQTRSQDLFALVRAMVAVEDPAEKESLLKRIDAQTSSHMLMDSINSTNSLRSRKSMKSQTSIISDDQGYINRYDIIDRPSGSCNFCGINKGR